MQNLMMLVITLCRRKFRCKPMFISKFYARKSRAPELARELEMTVELELKQRQREEVTVDKIDENCPF